MKKMIKSIFMLCALFVIVSILINLYICISTRKKINANNKKYEYILVLGAGIKNNNPSPMLEDRLKMAINIYKNSDRKIIISGDHEDDDYDEVIVMKRYLIDNGVLEADIISDDYGISTYDSLYRLKNNYNIDETIIVTQKYHLYRSIYIANGLGIDSVGADATVRRYFNQSKRDIREYVARIKDFFKVIIKPKSKY